MPLTDAELIAELRAVLPDLGAVDQDLLDDPVSHLTEHTQPALAPVANRAIIGEGASGKAAVDAAVRTAAEGVRSALAKIRRSGTDAELTPAERDGTEAIIGLVGRPALFIQDGAFFPPPQQWSHLEAHRDGIQGSIRAVGRIELSGHPTLDWVGTGFLVGDGLVMTNRHVAKEFATPYRAGGWAIDPDVSVSVNFREELNAGYPIRHDVTDVVGVSDAVDMALLRLEGAAEQYPPPLALAADPALEPEQEIYVIGHPWSDSRRNDLGEMNRIFNGVYGVKRLQPGKVLAASLVHTEFSHDASTLGGNSGSCVVDLETHLVVGLHFAGRYLVANRAVDLARATQAEPAFRDGLVFE